MVCVLSTHDITLTQLFFFSFIITPTQLLYIKKHITHVGMCIIAIVANMLFCLFVITRQRWNSLWQRGHSCGETTLRLAYFGSSTIIWTGHQCRERRSCQRGRFGPTPSSNRARSMNDSTPPPTSTATNQRVIELSTQVEATNEKCARYDARMRSMQRMLTSLCPSFPSMSMVRSLNTKYVHFCSCLYGDWWVFMKFLWCKIIRWNFVWKWFMDNLWS